MKVEVEAEFDKTYVLLFHLPGSGQYLLSGEEVQRALDESKIVRATRRKVVADWRGEVFTIIAPPGAEFKVRRGGA